jgi:4,5-dihydroxyphthalate decarboxylase
MTPLKLRFASRRYDRTLPVLNGTLGIDGVELRCDEWESVPGLFSAVFRGEYDVAEMSLAELVHYTSHGTAQFVGVPVFPSRIFRHGYIFCRAGAGIDGPGSLSGKRVGFPRLVQTACIWIHGLLVEEYGMSPKQTPLFVGGTHHWDEGDGERTFKTPDGSTVHQLPRVTPDENENLERALLDGTIDVLGTTRIPRPLLAGEGTVHRLFPDPPEAEAAYLRKTGIFPIMHVLVVRKEIVEQRPDLPAKLFDLFVRAKRAGAEWLDMDPSIGLAWKNRYLAQERALFGGDPWVYGLAPNQHNLAKFISYCDALGISARPLQPRELFHPSTWTLEDR